MGYLSDDYTDKELASLEKKINKEYSKAKRELTQTAKEYFESMKKKYEKQLVKLNNGEITQQEFNTWYQNAVGRGERWEKLRDDMAERLTRTNEVASSYINDKTPTIFTLNANYENYEIEKGSGVSFSIYDEQTVKRLIKDNPQILPKSKVSYPKDVAWNKSKLNSELTSAILQGKSIDKLADAFQHVTDMDRNSAIRNARTAVTGAQNGGRMESYKSAQKMGIDLQKQWIATHDGLTRKSHQDVDGETIGVNETFSNDCMYPGDPGGHPAEVYNCRCTMRAVIKDINDKKDSSAANKTYYQYIDDKKKQKTLESGRAASNSYNKNEPFGVAGIGTDHAKNMKDILDNKCLDKNVSKVYSKFGDQLAYIGVNPKDKDKSEYVLNKNGVMMDLEKVSVTNSLYDAYQTAFHEFSHMIDYISYNVKDECFSCNWHNGEIFKSLQKDFDNLIAGEAKKQYIEQLASGKSHITRYITTLDSDLKRIIREEKKNGASDISLLNKYWPQIMESTDKESLENLYIKDLLASLRAEKLPIKTVSGGSDILEAFTIEHDITFPLGYGHGGVYYKDTPELSKKEAVSTELMSHYMESNAVGNKEYVDYLYRLFPNGMNSIAEMIKELAK